MQCTWVQFINIFTPGDQFIWVPTVRGKEPGELVTFTFQGAPQTDHIDILDQWGRTFCYTFKQPFVTGIFLATPRGEEEAAAYRDKMHKAAQLFQGLVRSWQRYLSTAA